MHSLTTRGSASSQRFSLFPKTISGEKYSASSLPGQLVGSIKLGRDLVERPESLEGHYQGVSVFAQ